jgi:hypothetical protein
VAASLRVRVERWEGGEGGGEVGGVVEVVGG